MGIDMRSGVSRTPEGTKAPKKDDSLPGEMLEAEQVYQLRPDLRSKGSIQGETSIPRKPGHNSNEKLTNVVTQERGVQRSYQRVTPRHRIDLRRRVNEDQDMPAVLDGDSCFGTYIIIL